MARNKVWFHVAANCAGCAGIGNMWATLDAAGVPFGVYSANDGGLIASAAHWPRATLVYRDVEASTVNPADYARRPAEVAPFYWARTLAKLPAGVAALKGRVWLELLNEPGREPEQAAWVGELMHLMATRALAEGWRVCGPGWAPGNPEPEAWRTSGWTAYLRLCERHPGSVAVSLHEYALSNDIRAGEGWLIGRFRQLFAACDAAGMGRPRVFVTECGWTLNSMPADEQAKRDIAWLAELYGREATIEAAFLWTLQGGKGNGELPQRLSALRPWLTEYARTTTLPDGDYKPPAEGGTVATNVLRNGSFEAGWSDATGWSGQHPNEWEVAWNIGEAYPNPHGGQAYLPGEAVHKSRAMLPAAERGVFVWDGEWTFKLFGAGTKAFWARLKQRVELPAGRYELRTPVWVDCYRWGGYKDYAVEPWQAEIMVKANGKEARPWSLMVAGGRRDVVTAIEHAGGPLELAVHLRCNWAISNNLWLDGWGLYASEPEPPPPQPPDDRHTAIVVKVPQETTAGEWQTAAALAFKNLHTMTASHDDMMTLLRGGNARSYVKMAWPERASQQFAARLVEEAGYRWEPLVVPAAPGGGGEWRFEAYPVDGPRAVTQAFGVRPDAYQQWGFPAHEGIDLRAGWRANVRAVAAGTVAAVGAQGNYGNRVRVAHAGGWETTYAHLDGYAAGLAVGDRVEAGQVIGYAGSSGNSTGVHLHLTLKREGYMYTSPGGVVWPFNIHDPTPYIEPFLASIDLLPYLNGGGKWRLYEVRHPDGQTERFQTQTAGAKFYLVKNSQWEELWADEAHIWRGMDTSPAPDAMGRARFYVQREAGQEGARWCPRRMVIGQTWTGPGHAVQFYAKSDCAPLAQNSGRATNRMSLSARHAAKTWHGVTVDDVVELTNGTETWFYALGLGLVAWRASWGESAVFQVHEPGARPDNVRERIGCMAR